MKQDKNIIVWILTFFVAWVFISIYVYVCTIRGFCRSTEDGFHTQDTIKVVDDNRKDEWLDDEKNIVDKVDDTVVENHNVNVTKKVVATDRVIKCFTYLNSTIALKSKKNISTEVIKLEQFFNNLYDKKLNENGIYDKDDEFAVKEFQLENNLESDGVVGPQTLRLINAIYCVKTEKK